MGSITGSTEVPIARYLWQRIRQLGVRSVMGVPGDMNLELLDYIDEVDGLTWVGNSNELNAAYASDGYCRVKGCPGVFVTTMGVGELSAINGVAGAYTENVKLIHIVGTTGMKAQEARAMIHHSLGPDPDHRVYAKISESVRAAHCWLDNAITAPSEIDRVIKECYIQSLPVYIFVPMDFVHKPVSSAALEKLPDVMPTTDGEACRSAVDMVVKKLHSSLAPSIIVDALVARFGAAAIANQLIDQLAIPTFTTPMGKSIIDEDKPCFHGVYNGRVSLSGVLDIIENQCDLVIDVGPCHSDSNTGGHSRNLTDREQYILIAADYVQVGHARYSNVHIVEFLTRLSETLATKPVSLNNKKSNTVKLPPPPADAATHITQSWIWTRIGAMTKPGDIVIGESGTAQFGLSDAHFAPGVQYITQIYFGSIGYSVPAALGAAVAQAESESEPGRIILVVGDGSVQLTVQEIGTMVKLRLKNVLILVINNSGYTIERAIHGPTKGYNDIASWNHQLLLSAFGAEDGGRNSRRVYTKAEFEKAISTPEYVEPSSIQLLEVIVDKMDVPWRLQAQIDLINERNKANGK